MADERIFHLNSEIRKIDRAINFLDCKNVRVIVAETFCFLVNLWKDEGKVIAKKHLQYQRNAPINEADPLIIDLQRYMHELMKQHVMKNINKVIQYVDDNTVFLDFTVHDKDVYYVVNQSVQCVFNLKHIITDAIIQDNPNRKYAISLAQYPLIGYIFKKKKGVTSFQNEI
jgi:hypothetical protein